MKRTGTKIAHIGVKYCVVSLAVFAVLAVVGLARKTTYTDFNSKEDAIDDFVVATLSEDLALMQIERMEENLDSENIIAAVTCTGGLHFRSGCTSQPVTVVKVFKGDVSENESFEIINSNNIYSVKDVNGNEYPGINLSFSRVMQTDETYLVFLDRKLENHEEDDPVYILSDYVIKPIFSYTENNDVSCPANAEYFEDNWVFYRDVCTNEFFLSTETGVESLQRFKEELLEKYKL